jgi:hypothetical protein
MATAPITIRFRVQGTEAWTDTLARVIEACDPTPPSGRTFAGQRCNRWEAFALDYAGWLMHLAPTPDVRLASRLIERVPGLASLDALRSTLREVCGVEVEAVVEQAAQARAAR